MRALSLERERILAVAKINPVLFGPFGILHAGAGLWSLSWVTDGLAPVVSWQLVVGLLLLCYGVALAVVGLVVLACAYRFHRWIRFGPERWPRRIRAANLFLLSPGLLAFVVLLAAIILYLLDPMDNRV